MQLKFKTLGRVLFFIIFGLAVAHAQTDSTYVLPSKLVQLQSYIDSTALAGMKEYNIPGATITIITDSSQVYYNSYGMADLENQIAVDKDQTIFRIASITKTFTATAIMQLVQEGKLELHRDIRDYLPDDDFDFLSEKPITLHHLLTHTAGFDLTDNGDAALVPEKIIPLEEMARRYMPDRIYDPGDVHSYSNYGYTLLGYIIQNVSGMPYEDYMRSKLFEPLEMVHTGIKQPLPEPYKSNLARSYVWKEKQVYLPRDYTNTLPGGGVISSAGDMRNYMLMHLNAGNFKGKQILNSEFHKILTSQHYGAKNTRYGVCYSFFENRWTGRRSLEHSGGQLGFVSLMVLVPEIGYGVFISHNNRKDAGGFRYDFMRAISDTLIGRKSNNFDSIAPNLNFEKEAHKYTGVFKQMNYPHASFEKMARLFGMFSTEYKMEYDGKGGLTAYGDTYVPVGNNIFRLNEPDTDYTIEFIMDESGKAKRLMIGTTSYERISWFKKKRVQQGFFIPSLFFLLLLVLSRPLGWLFGRIRNNKPTKSTNKTALSKWLYRTALLFVLGALIFTLYIAIGQDQLADYGIPFGLKVSFGLISIGFVFALAAPYFMYQNWSSKSLKIKSKLFNSFLILFVMIVATTFYIYNLVGFNYYY